ncbi:unnamed protein product [Rhizophagus irregularis]|nr:unnamed protein product [Rhizophagus irregularis]
MEIKGPSACFFGIRNGLSVFDFGKQGTERVPDVRMMVPDVWMKRPGTPERIHEPDFGWKITLTSTSAKLELKWLRSSKRKCLAKVKGMKGKGSAAIGQTGIQYFEGSAAYWTYGIQHFEGMFSGLLDVQRLIGRMEFNISKVFYFGTGADYP